MRHVIFKYYQAGASHFHPFTALLSPLCNFLVTTLTVLASIFATLLLSMLLLRTIERRFLRSTPKMATAQTWMFSCGHEYTLIPSTPNHPPQPRLVQALVQAQSMTSPDSCPSCLDEVRRAEERRKDQLAEAVEALKAYKSHGTVLERQLVSFAGNPTLVEVYKSLERDCILYQAQKVNEIFLLRNFRREGYDSMNAVEKLRALEFEREGMKFMQIAAGAALERSEVRQFDG